MNNKQHFIESGYRIFKSIVHVDELEQIQQIYDDFFNNKYDLTVMRSDLSGDKTAKKKVEKITQIMRPSTIVPELTATKTYKKVLKIAKELMGDDMEIDFDMLINKAPGTKTETPWHQDAAHWPKASDKRALSFWLALDDVDAKNGCMRYIHGSHVYGLRPHNQPTPDSALQCEVNEDELVVVGEIKAGMAIVHDGFTLHGAFGNNARIRNRRALIINLRPKEMISHFRDLGFDHLGKKEIKTKKK
jgi:ectoine hydroxylase-related dioxygenase (phytanoyl-CoA dioxygenase family)